MGVALSGCAVLSSVAIWKAYAIAPCPWTRWNLPTGTGIYAAAMDEVELAGKPRERIGIFGGTFDPIHVGHLVAAVNARHALSLDRVLMMVANVPWQKAGERAVTSAEERYEVVRAAVGGVPGLEAGRNEIDRGGESYTADTLQEVA